MTKYRYSRKEIAERLNFFSKNDSHCKSLSLIAEELLEPAEGKEEKCLCDDVRLGLSTAGLSCPTHPKQSKEIEPLDPNTKIGTDPILLANAVWDLMDKCDELITTVNAHEKRLSELKNHDK